jgi:hypothetical protein
VLPKKYSYRYCHVTVTVTFTKQDDLLPKKISLKPLPGMPAASGQGGGVGGGGVSHDIGHTELAWGPGWTAEGKEALIPTPEVEQAARLRRRF